MTVMDRKFFDSAQDESKIKGKSRTRKMIEDIKENFGTVFSLTEIKTATGLSPRTIRLALRAPIKAGEVLTKKIEGEWFYTSNLKPQPKNPTTEGDQNGMVQDDGAPNSS